MANIIGGVVAYGIGNVPNDDVASWQLLFLVLGTITCGLGMILFVLLPDSPATTIILTKRQRAVAVQRTLTNKTGVLDTGSFRWEQVWMALKDPQTWLLFLYNFCVNLCNGGVTTVSLPRSIRMETIIADRHSSRPLSLTDLASRGSPRS